MQKNEDATPSSMIPWPDHPDDELVEEVEVEEEENTGAAGNRTRSLTSSSSSSASLSSASSASSATSTSTSFSPSLASKPSTTTPASSPATATAPAPAGEGNEEKEAEPRDGVVQHSAGNKEDDSPNVRDEPLGGAAAATAADGKPSEQVPQQHSQQQLQKKKKKRRKKGKAKAATEDTQERREAEDEEEGSAKRSSGVGVAGEGSGSGSWIILGQLGTKPRKEEFGDDKEARRQYRAAKKEWGERKRTLIDSLSPDEVREYKKEKKELTEKERLERKRERQERRRLMKEKKKLYKKPKIGKLVTQETKSYELVCDMLLGIRVTVSKVSARPLHGNAVKDSDFRRVHNLRFPSTGSTNGVIPTPAHSQRDFTFRDYAPVVFRRLREHFGIEADDYLISLTGDYILSELISPGQSGQFFYFSYDLRFMLKTITRGEAKFLKAILPRYYNHIIENPNTLIARFFGFHRVAPHRDRKHYFVVMGNIFAQNLELHYRFDLKGSTVGRVTSPEKIKNDPNVVMKDQDFDRLRKTIALGPEKRKLFIDQVVKDVDLLEELGIMDYSLLVGIHDRRRLQKGRSLSMVYLPKAIDDEQVATAKGFNADTETDSSESESDEEKLEQHHVTVFTQDQGGIQSTDEEDQPTDYIYFIGIIDILQPFNIRKRAEHGLKSFRFDGSQISAVNPKLYAKRFKDYVFARVKQPETPQTPREVIGLPPRPPEAEDKNTSDDESDHVDDLGHNDTSMGVRDGNNDAGRKAKGKGKPLTTESAVSDGSGKIAQEQGAVSPRAEKRSKKKKIKQKGVPAADEMSDGIDSQQNGEPATVNHSTSGHGTGAEQQESSPRAGNAGLIPKQLKVEKKKQQKMAAKKKHKGTITSNSTDDVAQGAQGGVEGKKITSLKPSAEVV